MTLKNFCIGFLIATLLLIGYVVEAGIAVVHVKTPDTHIWIPVPVAVGHLVGKFIDLPLSQEPEFETLLDYGEEAVEIVRQLKDLPDSILVEVSKTRERVRIFKRGGSLCIDVDNANEKVKVRLPLHAAEGLLEALSHRHVNVGDLVACLEWQPAGDIVHVKNGNEEVRISIW